MIAAFRILLLVVAALVYTAALLPFHAAGLAAIRAWAARVPVLWHRGIARLLGIRVTVRGRPSSDRPLLIVANHVSWKDIVILGTVMPLSFIAKDEMRDWPVFGWLARLQRSVFVARDRQSSTGMQVGEITARLAAHDVMVLFPEGTTGDGNRLLPFKSSLIGAAQAAARATVNGACTVQPVALAYLSEAGLPLGHAGRIRHSWVGDQALVPHLKDRLLGRQLHVEVCFGEPLVMAGDGDRKAVTRRLEAAIAAMLIKAHHGKNDEDGQ